MIYQISQCKALTVKSRLKGQLQKRSVYALQRLSSGLMGAVHALGGCTIADIYFCFHR